MVNSIIKVALIKYKLKTFKMSNRNEGLTVGELTISIAILIIIGFIWNISNNKEDNPKLSSEIERVILSQKNI